jgi:hypothetical protein
MLFDEDAWTENVLFVVIPLRCPVCGYTSVMHVELISPLSEDEELEEFEDIFFDDDIPF